MGRSRSKKKGPVSDGPDGDGSLVAAVSRSKTKGQVSDGSDGSLVVVKKKKKKKQMAQETNQFAKLSTDCRYEITRFLDEVELYCLEEAFPKEIKKSIVSHKRWKDMLEIQEKAYSSADNFYDLYCMIVRNNGFLPNVISRWPSNEKQTTAFQRGRKFAKLLLESKEELHDAGGLNRYFRYLSGTDVYISIVTHKGQHWATSLSTEKSRHQAGSLLWDTNGRFFLSQLGIIRQEGRSHRHMKTFDVSFGPGDDSLDGIDPNDAGGQFMISQDVEGNSAVDLVSYKNYRIEKTTNHVNES